MGCVEFPHQRCGGRCAGPRRPRWCKGGVFLEVTGSQQEMDEDCTLGQALFGVWETGSRA